MISNNRDLDQCKYAYKFLEIDNTKPLNWFTIFLRQK